MNTSIGTTAGARWVRRVLLATALLLSAAALAALVLVKTMPVSRDADYVGSKACASCHRRDHTAWADSLHPKMMRPVGGDGVVVADLSPTNEDLPFDPAQAVWAIGSKWEQQFMGHDGAAETLLPGAWLVEPERWQRTGWDGWQVPEPVRRCHGCHTVGLDVETGHFVEPGVGCEACHGPGSWHARTFGLGRISSSPDAQVCGQCHARGRAKDGDHFFPVGYRPGDALDEYFDEDRPSPGQSTSYWWGNGRERKRHQEYQAWRRGGHANSLDSLRDGYDGRYGDVSPGCLRCHSAAAALHGRRASATLDDAQWGVTCAVCHNVHGQLDEPRLSCRECHGEGAFHHEPARNAEHVACPADAQVGCVGCHMPRTGLNGGAYTLHSHAPGIVPPADTASEEVPNSCANGGCHADRDQAWLEDAFERHYGDATTVPREDQRQSGSASWVAPAGSDGTN